MISHSKKIVFIHVPKTGGTSFSNFLRPYCDEQSLRYYSPFGPSEDANLHATAYDYIYSYGKGNLDDYTFVSIIRNPWEKVVSHSIHHNGGEFDREHFRKLIFKPYRNGFWPNSHFHFFRKVAATGKMPDGTPALPEAWPATLNIGGLKLLQEELIFPEIIRFENYADDAAKFLDKHSIEHNYEDLKKKTNSTKHTHYSHYYQDDEIQEIKRTCALDIQIYGFSFDDRRDK
jgi:hypothetical protein